MPNITEIIKNAPESLILGVFGIAALLVLGIPLSLEIVREFRNENKTA